MSESPIQIDVNVNLSLFQQTLGEYSNQVPFAAMKAINNTAVDVQNAIRQHIGESFIVRRKSFIDRSVKIKPFATKDNLSATVSIDPPGGESRDVLSKFEDGGTKTSISGGKLAVPMEDAFDKNKVIPASKRPKNNPKLFKITAKNGKQYLVTSIGRGKNRTLKFNYDLESSTHIPNNLKFVETAIKTVNDVWDKRFDEAWNLAVSTAK